MFRPAFALCSAALFSAAVSSGSGPAQATQNQLVFGTQRYALPHVQAVKTTGSPDEIWVVLTSKPVSAQDAADKQKMLSMAMSGQLRAVRVAVDAKAPQADDLQLALLMSRAESPSGEISVGGGGGKFWDRVSVSGSRVQGKVHVVWDSTENGTKPWTLDLDFSATVQVVK